MNYAQFQALGDLFFPSFLICPFVVAAAAAANSRQNIDLARLKHLPLPCLHSGSGFSSSGAGVAGGQLAGMI